MLVEVLGERLDAGVGELDPLEPVGVHDDRREVVGVAGVGPDEAFGVPDAYPVRPGSVDGGAQSFVHGGPGVGSDGDGAGDVLGHQELRSGGVGTRRPRR